MNKLSGFQRFKLTRLWYEKYSEHDKEAFIKKACEQRGLTYTPPIDLQKAKAISSSAKMFPKKIQ